MRRKGSRATGSGEPSCSRGCRLCSSTPSSGGDRGVTDLEAFPTLDPGLIGDDIAYPAMLKFLPEGWMGLMVGGLIAANSSTILTLLNWGALYLVHDFYRRFVQPGRDEKHYVFAGRIATVGLFFCSAAMVYLLDTAQGNFNLMLQIGAGTGLLYLVRWFWWRITALVRNRGHDCLVWNCRVLLDSAEEWYGRGGYALALLAIVVVSGLSLIGVVRRLWT